MKVSYQCGIFAGCLFCLGVYWYGLSGPLMLDDGPQLIPVMNSVNGSNGLHEWSQHIVSNSGQLGRAIPMATFIVNAIFFGADVFWWKLTNVVLHCVNGILIFVFLAKLLHSDFECKSLALPLALSLLWLLHPIQVGTVLYLVQRMAILSTTFLLLSFISYLVAMEAFDSNRKRRTFLFLSAGLFFPMALLCKENAITYPLFIIAMFYFKPKELSPSHRDSKAILEHKIFAALMALILLVGAAILVYDWGNLVEKGYEFRNFTLNERLMTQARISIMYLFQILLPLPSAYSFFYDDIQVSQSLLKPVTTLLSIVMLILLVFIGCVYRKTKPLLAFGIAFFIISHLVESTIFPLELAFEHRNYLALLGVLVALSGVIRIERVDKSVSVAVFVFMLVLLSGSTVYRSYIWGDAQRLFPYLLSVRPESPRLLILFSDTYSSAGQYDQALKYLNKLEGLGVELQRVSILCAENKADLNDRVQRINVENEKISNYELEGLMKVSNQILDNVCRIDALKYVVFLDRVIGRPIINGVAKQKLLLYRGHLLHKGGDFSGARESLLRSFEADKSNPIPLFLLVEWLVEQGNYIESRSVFERAKFVATSSKYDYTEFLRDAEIKLENGLNKKDF